MSIRPGVEDRFVAVVLPADAIVLLTAGTEDLQHLAVASVSVQYPALDDDPGTGLCMHRRTSSLSMWTAGFRFQPPAARGGGPNRPVGSHRRCARTSGGR